MALARRQRMHSLLPSRNSGQVPLGAWSAGTGGACLQATPCSAAGALCCHLVVKPEILWYLLLWLMAGITSKDQINHSRSNDFISKCLQVRLSAMSITIHKGLNSISNFTSSISQWLTILETLILILYNDVIVYFCENINKSSVSEIITDLTPLPGLTDLDRELERGLGGQSSCLSVCFTWYLLEGLSVIEI